MQEARSHAPEEYTDTAAALKNTQPALMWWNREGERKPGSVWG